MLIARDPIRNNWYQRDGFFASSFALVSTVNADGSFNLRPYQLALPYRIDGTPELLLITRLGARTAENIQRTGRCVLNFVEFGDRARIDAVTQLGNPFLTHKQRDALNPFTFIAAPDGALEEAVQVFECALISAEPTSRAVYLELELAQLHVEERFAAGVPDLPITLGARNGNQMWFAQLGEPFYTEFELPG